ncbi:uncharacterized protein LOC142172474 [Nicotiana tabacum]|uniref:Uncharacterized protein LOC142172474 n=1 Tax=Nicotiana tabacum TaxID=4097 RepID=A0AC58T4P5_TOBAC
MTETAQMMHCEITGSAYQTDCLVTFIYGFNTIEQMRGLWEDLKTVAQGITKPWLVIKVFNAILSSVDRDQGNPVQQADVQDFVDCIQTTNLNEVIWKWDYYTWTNKQRVEDRIQSRIDKAFGNYEWMMKWGNIVVEYDLPGIFNHTPMLLTMGEEQNNTRCPFRFFNVWADHIDFDQIIEETWEQHKDPWLIKGIWRKLKALKTRLRY